MDDPNVVSSLERFAVPAIISVVVAIVTAVITVWQQTTRLRHEFELQRERLRTEFELQRERLRTELKLEFAIETAIRDLLSDPRFKEGKRTFEQIKKRLDIFEQDRELRQHLVRAGAVRFERKSDNVELWGLREHTDENEMWDAGSGDAP